MCGFMQPLAHAWVLLHMPCESCCQPHLPVMALVCTVSNVWCLTWARALMSVLTRAHILMVMGCNAHYPCAAAQVLPLHLVGAPQAGVPAVPGATSFAL
jgi:hypothetical protein